MGRQLLRSISTALLVVALGGLLAQPSPASAAFHLWQIEEVFSNADGRVQYIELFTAFGGQGVLGGHTISATSGGVTRTFTFPAGLTGDTTGRHMILATPGFAALPGAVSPDYVLPCGAFFDPGGTGNITLDFGPGFSVVTFPRASLPTNGTTALYDLDHDGLALTMGPSSPRNFDGDAGAVVLTGCLAAGTCDPCADSMFCNGAEACSGSACAAGPAVCVGRMCNEATDMCFGCTTPAACSDGTFCNGAETCVAGACAPPLATACPTSMCDEAMDVCFACSTAAHCSDGLFCNGDEVCTSGRTCAAGTARCAGMMCDDTLDVCFECATAADCNDSNPCTDDACAARACTHTANTAGCDDGLFCNGADTCAASACGHAGTPCGTASCNEGSDTCGACAVSADCDDDLFCNGAETCGTDLECDSGTSPCGSSEACDEVADACNPVCGNGVVQTGEDCDDDDTDAGDGCSATCEVEAGFACAGEPSVCTMLDAGVLDAGVPDAGSAEDAGIMVVDAGRADAGRADAGVRTDAAPGLDAGPPAPPASSGCACAVAPRTSPRGALLVLAALGLVLARRRKRSA